MKWDTIKGGVLPLDIIFFRGSDKTSELISIMEKYSTSCGQFTHIGIVITSELLPSLKLTAGEYYVWESTFSTNKFNIDGAGAVDVISHAGYFGSQLRNIKELIPHYLKNTKARMAWGKLLNNPWATRRAETIQQMEVIFKELDHRRYDYDPLSLLGAVFSPIRGARDIFIPKRKLDSHGILYSDEMLFCSEMVASVYVKLGLLPDTVNPENALPVDFLGHDSDGEIPPMVDDVIDICVD